MGKKMHFLNNLLEHAPAISVSIIIMIKQPSTSTEKCHSLQSTSKSQKNMHRERKFHQGSIDDNRQTEGKKIPREDP